MVGRLLVQFESTVKLETRNLLATLSGHLAAVVRNVQLVDDLQAQVALLEGQKAALDTLNERLQHAREEERAPTGGRSARRAAANGPALTAPAHRRRLP